MDKALVKKTGEVLDIKTHYFTKPISIEIEGIEIDDLPSEWKEFWHKGDSTIISPEDKYILSDNKEYNSEDLVVGVENIRDYKITNQININE